MPQDKTIPVSSEDPEMEAAITLARQSLGVFLASYSRPKKNQKAFLIKVRFEEDGQSEHIWLADLDLSKMPSRGTVANEPKLRRLKFMQIVEFEPSQITDWMYVEDGYLIGGFTTEIIRRRMSPNEREAYEAVAPYKFHSGEDAMAILKKAWDALP